MKKITIKTTLVFIGLAFFIQTNFSQNVSYTYDAAGNRTGRSIAATQRSSDQPVEKVAKATTSISDTLADFSVKIYPNPTEGKVRIDINNLPVGEKANLNLYNVSGHLIVSKKNVTSSTEINIHGHHKGVYILKVIAGKQQKEWKIVKK